MMNIISKLKLFKISIFLTIFIVSSILSLHAQITDTIYVTYDADINESSPNSNYGNTNTMYVGDQDKWRGLVYFDLSSIPSNALVSSASIILRAVGGSSQSVNIASHVVQEEWEEMYVTWYRRTSTQNWSTIAYPYYFDPTALSTLDVYNNNSFYSFSITSAAQGWMNGTLPNYGIIFAQTSNSANHERYFASSEDIDVNDRPKLVITYTTTIDSLWLRGNYGTNTTTDGNIVTNWTNVYAPDYFYQDNTTYAPTYRITNDNINYNPVIQFDGSNDFLKGRLNYGIYGQNNFTTFAVLKSSGNDKYIWSQFSYRTNSASHSIANTQRIGSYTLFRNGITTIPTTPTLLGIRRNASNNFSLFYNGINETTNSITGFGGSFIGNNLLLGSRGGAPSNTLNGAIAEMMVFNRNLSDAEILRINSYLATKYGLSLTNNYTASNGTIFWSQSADSQFNNGIFGIGRDNSSSLHQQISLSTSNTYNFLTLSTDSNFQLPNSQHTSVANNLSFFMVGSNSTSEFMFQTTELNTSIYSSRIDYEWLVQSTNYSQSVNLKFQGCGSSDLRLAYLIKKNGNSNFNAGITEVGILDSNGVITGVTLNNNDYFTVFFKNLSPGGVGSNLRFWAKADFGTVLSGTNVIQWKDIVNNFYLYQNTSARRPVIKTNGQNFNPSITFTASNSQFFERNTSYNIFTGSYSIYIVGYNRSGTRAFMTVTENGYPSSLGVLIETSDPSTLRFLHQNWWSDNLSNSVSMSRSSHNIFSFYRNSSIKHKYWVNGTNSYELNPFSLTWEFLNNEFTDLTVGRNGATSSGYLDGEIAELIIFNSENETSRIKIESYLATKYGISINDGTGVNYIASDSTTIFWNRNNNIGYNYDIFGIGKDEISTLNQKQSRSANADAFFSVYLLPTASDVLPTTNQLNTTSFDGDKSFLMFGNNNDSIALWTTNTTMPAQFKYRLKRVWKFQKTGTVNNAVIAISTTDLPVNTGSLPIYLLISDSPDMTNATYYPMTLVSSYWRVQHNFTSGSYMTFGYGYVAHPLRHGKTVIEGVRFPYK